MWSRNQLLTHSDVRGGGGGEGVAITESMVNGFSQVNKGELNVISTLSSVIAELSLYGMWRTTCCA